jgi:phage tail sheath protein FI
MPDRVRTAIPAFVGYTEIATIDGKPAYLSPVRLESLADYQSVFGAAFKPTCDITEADANAGGFAAQHWDGASGRYVVKHYASSPLGAFNLYNSVRLFYANGGATCYVCSVGSDLERASAIDRKKLAEGLTAVGAQVGPTLLAVPEAVLLPSVGDFTDLTRHMLAQCATLQDRVALLDVYGADTLDQTQPTYGVDLEAVIDTFHECVGDTSLDYGAAYFPFLITSIVQPTEIDFTNFHVTGPDNAWPLLQAILTDQAAYLYPGKDPGPTGNEDPTFTRVKGWIDQIPATTDPAAVQRLNQDLVTALPLLGLMENGIRSRMNLLPPSAAMAGVCTMVDSTAGVWQAPANIVLNAVELPSVRIDDDQQGSINVPLDGKSINVIREFAGRGPVVWGARTLDGNSGDWRYVQIRRTAVYIETSIKAALSGFASAPNDGKTWVAVVDRVSGFLQNLWAQGGLAGAKASDAFSVDCGLGTTMTGRDVLEGYMIVTVVLQLIRPGEFIELTFKQRMQP